MKIQEIQEKIQVNGDTKKLGQYDLLYNYGTIVWAWYILGVSTSRVHP